MRPASRSSNIELTVSSGVLLVRPDHPGGAALDPADRVVAGDLLAALGIDDPAGLVRDQAAPGVERDPVEPGALVADRAQHQPALDLLALAGVAGADRARLVAVELVAADDDAARPCPRPRSRPASSRSASRRASACPRAARSEKSVKISTLRRWVGSQSSDSRYARLAGSSSISAGSMTMSASVSSPSSRTSGLVNAAWAGPRRPRTTISSTPEPASASIAWSAVSVTSSSPWGRASIRATSAATLPLPITTARFDGQVEVVVGEVGVGVVPVDELGGRVRAGQVLARDPELAVGRRAVGGDDRVVALLELGDGDVGADRRRCRRSGSPRGPRSSRRRGSPT